MKLLKVQLRAIGSIMNNIVPMSSLRNEIARLINPYMRVVEQDIFESIANRNPIAKGVCCPVQLDYR